LFLPCKNRKSWKNFSEANTLAYSAAALVMMKKKGFITSTPEQNGKLDLLVNNAYAGVHAISSNQVNVLDTFERK
jgi:hypothetical protein